MFRSTSDVSTPFVGPFGTDIFHRGQRFVVLGTCLGASGSDRQWNFSRNDPTCLEEKSSLTRLHPTPPLASPETSDAQAIFRPLIPLKFDNDSIVPAGLIFIGFATHQTTGNRISHSQSLHSDQSSGKVSNMQNPYIAVWNRELLNFQRTDRSIDLRPNGAQAYFVDL